MYEFELPVCPESLTSVHLSLTWSCFNDVSGLANEGWFDSWLFLSALKIKTASLGVEFVKGELVGFIKEEVDRARQSPEKLKFAEVS